MSTAPSASVPASGTSSAPNSDVTKLEHSNQNSQVLGSENSDAQQVNWESELQLVSSLAKLQELERKVHELRQFLPEGLLEPLVPEKPAPDSPAQLRNDLEQATRARLAGVESFQSLWRGTEMKPVWSHVESRIKESNGDLIQPTGMWEKDYDVLLKELIKTEKTKKEDIEREQEQIERSKAQSSDGEWQAIVERFTQRDVPGMRVVKGQDPFSVSAVLAKAGMIFSIKGLQEPGVPGVSEWQVSSEPPPGRSPSKLQHAVQDCLNSRTRKWDLAFLLDMVSSYVDIKQTTCVKCNRLADNSAQLPTIRRVQSTQPSQNNPPIFTFDTLHLSCA
ncbi:hypothetical protein N7509_002831 [Penicillium cosmopolitanum]|uniref:Mediator complex subunit 27 n=1 Tax=Penicillium cosmopolitanum TaxID=1131564 RepID=A0A9W9W9S4_9EURO|nr:uncharacterized protein N7509_002831 [Penicillium cosmopolitanum]KAJ5408948.1 hypothetical protein N7509_002831 [Penicillium cosmopolitanum]